MIDLVCVNTIDRALIKIREMDKLAPRHTCSWCGIVYREDNCPACGAPQIEKKQAVEHERPMPIAYNGYIVWPITNWPRDEVCWYFYLGDKVIEIIKMSRQILRELISEYCDPMPTIWDLFLVAQGETEVLKIKEQNTMHPAEFEIRRIDQ